MDFLWFAIMFTAGIIIMKGAYEIYYTGIKAFLKEKPIVKYGLPLLCALMLMPYIMKALG